MIWEKQYEIGSFRNPLQSDTLARNRFIFVTHNKEEFSQPRSNQKMSHADFEAFFSVPRSQYYISLSEALNSIKPKMISKMLAERELSRSQSRNTHKRENWRWLDQNYRRYWKYRNITVPKDWYIFRVKACKSMIYGLSYFYYSAKLPAPYKYLNQF